MTVCYFQVRVTHYLGIDGEVAFSIDEYIFMFREGWNLRFAGAT